LAIDLSFLLLGGFWQASQAFGKEFSHSFNLFVLEAADSDSQVLEPDLIFVRPWK
jgi:hypothetical protein